jgi:fatty acid desaturase
MRRTATTWFSTDEIRELMTPTTWQGARSLLTTWGLIAAAFVLLATFPRSPLAWLTTLIILGGRQLALAILMHECAHQSLFPRAITNQLVGTWLCAAPVWQRLNDYRTHHVKHHGRTSMEDDPDLDLSSAFPTSRWGLARKFARDLTGIAFLRRVAALLLMDAGVLSYTASTGARWVSPRPSVAQMLKSFCRNFGPVFIANSLLALTLAALGHAWLFGVWVIAWATTFSLFLRIRAIAEHGVTERSTDPLKNTRTTRANLMARLTVAPHHVNFHLEHHLLPTVPHYRLPAMHRLLVERGAWAEATQADGYLDVLRLASTPH